MSKRFGRQQKKKLKLEVENLQGKIANLKYRNKEDVSTVEAAKGIISTVARVNRHHPSIKHSFVGDHYFTHINYSYSDMSPLVALSGSTADTAIDIRRIDLYDFESAMRVDEIENNVIFRTTVSQRNTREKLSDWCYKVSKTFMKEAPRDYLVEMISNQIAGLVYKEVGKL